MRRTMVALAAVAGALFSGCKQQLVVAAPVAAELIRDEEAALSEREAERVVCANPVSIYEGGITVDATSYEHAVARGDDFALAPIEDLDRPVSKSTKVRFTLDYPFDKPFEGKLAGKVTLRRIIDAIRAGFRTMYEGAAVKDIPGMMNKDVKGAYGSSLHGIGDLVIEHINWCDGDWLEIAIGS